MGRYTDICLIKILSICMIGVFAAFLAVVELVFQRSGSELPFYSVRKLNKKKNNASLKRPEIAAFLRQAIFFFLDQLCQT